MRGEIGAKIISKEDLTNAEGKGRGSGGELLPKWEGTEKTILYRGGVIIRFQ